MTDRIQNAIDVLDKMLNLPFEVFENNEIRDSTGTAIAEVWIRKKYDEHDVAELFAAAPDLAAEVIRLRKWQKEAVPYLNIAAARLMPKPLDFIRFNDAIDDIGRLIAEAEGE